MLTHYVYLALTRLLTQEALTLDTLGHVSLLL
jgi:hypothetical protein